MNLRTTMMWSICVIVALLALANVGPGTEQETASEILKATGVKGGLIVHLGCGDGRLTAALRAGDSYLVHGLDASADNVRKARAHIQSLGLYGEVSVEHLAGTRLPYADNLVNLLVSADLGEVPMHEVMRVLVPEGIAYVKRGDTWSTAAKPRPGNTDEWTHYMHDASGNAVAHDDLVGPPRYLQWVEEPRHTRSHEHIPGIYAVVSSGGRIFYIADQAPIASILRPAVWQLIARDAYNGTLLWERSISNWYPHLLNWGQAPGQLQRKLVAVGDRVYVTLGLHAPLTAVDAATGEVVKTYEGTEGTEEIVYHEGMLLLAVRSVTPERVAQLARWAQLMQEKDSPLYVRETAQPLVDGFRRTEGQAEVAMLALDADTGRVLWKKTGEEAAGLRAVSLSASGDRAFYQKSGEVVCLDRKTGRQLWSVPSAPMRLVSDDSVVCADGKVVTALSAATGQTQWTQTPMLTEIRDAFVAKGSLWLGGFKPIEGKRGPSWGPYFVTQHDLRTGKLLMHIEPENPGHHHRCYSNKATDRYILGGRRGTEFIDLSTGEVLWNSWARGVCRYGVMPCNGLLYTPPHACGCYVAAKLTGFNALSSTRSKETAATSEAPRLERGPAYETAAFWSSPSDWPTYRHDAGRSGSTRAAVPGVLRRLWQAEVGGKLTAPTIAAGKVFVASVEQHTLSALAADSGKPTWRFTGGARIDSAPTLYQGRALFGCRDGYVYSVRTTDGALVWRLRAAREERRVAVCGQLESASPVIGSVLVQDGVIHCTAGRSSYLDGGIDLCRVEPETGKTLSRTALYSPDPKTGRQPPHIAPAFMSGARADILSGDGSHVYLRDMVFDQGGVEQPQGDSHLFTLTDFLDDTWTHRSYWIFGTHCSLATGCSGREKDLVYGRLLVFDDSVIYGYGRSTVHWSNALQDGPYRLFATKRGEGTMQWEKPMTIQVRAMVLADKMLFVAGPPADARGPIGLADESQGAMLMAISAADGSELGQYRLDSAPLFDGMAAAGGRLYLATVDGRVLCMGAKG